MNWINKKLKGWRTIIVNAAFMVVPILDVAEFAAIVPDEYMKFYAFAMVIANMWLRYATTTKMGSAE